MLPQGSPKGNPSNVSMLGSTGEMQLSRAGSRHGELPHPHVSVPSTRPSCWTTRSPVLAWWQERKLVSDLGSWKLIGRFLSFQKKKYTQTWIFCALNIFIILLITCRVILTGSVLRHSCGSFYHSDKSSVFLKPLEISLPRKEICLLLACVGEHK